MRTEDGSLIDMNEEVKRIAEIVFDAPDVPHGAVVQVFQPVQTRHAGWTMLLIRDPVEKGAGEPL